MKDFGKFTAHNESVDIGGGEMVGIIIFRDANGIDWFELAAQFPHPWYICVSDEMRIQSMESSHESSQIAGHLIGIDSDFGYTRGPGGTVYGKIWNGTAIVDAPLEPAIVIVPAVTLWERLTQSEADQVGAVMETQPFRTRQTFLTANTFRSDHELWPLLVSMATDLFGEQRAGELLAPPL